MARSLRPRHAAAWPDSTLRLKLPATSACKRWEIRPCHPNVHHRFKSASATGALTASAAPHNPDELLRCSELTLRASRRHPPPSRRSSPHCLGCRPSLRECGTVPRFVKAGLEMSMPARQAPTQVRLL